MARKLDPVIADVLKQHGFGPEAAWDCHGTWVVYHRVLEQIAAKSGVMFEAPLVLEANGPAKSVALCVTGHSQEGRAEWSIGEAAPGNNKNAYPYAMAEKRAKDRVILKLIGLHGLAYSEDEADDFKENAPTPAPSTQPLNAAKPASIAADLNDRASKAKAWAEKSIVAIAKMDAATLTKWSGDHHKYIVDLKSIDEDLHGKLLQAMQDRDLVTSPMGAG